MLNYDSFSTRHAGTTPMMYCAPRRADMFGTCVCSNISLSFGESVWVAVGQGFVVISVCCGYPTVCWCANTCLPPAVSAQLTETLAPAQLTATGSPAAQPIAPPAARPHISAPSQLSAASWPPQSGGARPAAAAAAAAR
jgi:hypothetical protein